MPEMPEGQMLSVQGSLMAFPTKEFWYDIIHQKIA